MSEMIDRILAAWEELPIRDSVSPGGELDLLRKREAARSAIEAMREPTDAMFGGQYGQEPRRLFTEMIDAALTTRTDR